MQLDSKLRQRLEKIEQSLISLRVAEKKYLTLEAHRKVLFSQLYLQAQGKNVAEKEANAYATEDWQNFCAGHVEAESDYNHERRRYELQLKAYDAEHLTLKTEVPVIKRQGA
jgi:hypothetical protein